MLDIDTAIKHCLEVAEQEESIINYPHSDIVLGDLDIESRKHYAADHRQLAEWLTELKQWRRVYGICPSYEMCIPECREGYNAQIAEYKRLLKAAVEDLSCGGENNKCTKSCNTCTHSSIKNYGCRYFGEYHWRYEAEALALLGEDTNVPASADNTNVGHKSGGWISCKDRMPDDNELVLFCYVGESGIKSVHYGYHQTVRGLGSSWGKISGGWRYCNDDVTHWMPIPEPPKDGDTNG